MQRKKNLWPTVKRKRNRTIPANDIDIGITAKYFNVTHKYVRESKMKIDILSEEKGNLRKDLETVEKNQTEIIGQKKKSQHLKVLKNQWIKWTDWIQQNNKGPVVQR